MHICGIRGRWLKPLLWKIGIPHKSAQLFFYQAINIYDITRLYNQHYKDVIMGTMASQITSLTDIVYPAVYSGEGQRKHQSYGSLAFVQGIHRWPVNSPHKGPSNVEKVSIWWHHHDIFAWWHDIGYVVIYTDTLFCWDIQSHQKFCPHVQVVIFVLYHVGLVLVDSILIH